MEAFGRIGLAGEYEISDDNVSFGVDLKASPGVGGGFEVVAHPNFSIGARVQYKSITPDVDADDDELSSLSLIDLLVVPRGRFEVASGTVIYGGLPIGLVIGVPEGGDNENGFSLTILGGIEHFVSDHVGFFAEFGYQLQSFTFEENDEIELSIKEMTIQGGIKFALGSST